MRNRVGSESTSKASAGVDTLEAYVCVYINCNTFTALADQEVTKRHSLSSR
jgi:hypothetical protein